MALKKLFPQVYIPANLLNQSIVPYFNAWNEQFWDETGKFKREGSQILSDGHLRVIQALSYILIDRISLKNRQNKQSQYPKNINVTKPIRFFVNTNDIKNVMTKKMKRSVSLGTIKNRLKRLTDAGLISKEFDKSKGRYLMHFSPFLLPVMNKKDGELLKNTNFLDVGNQTFSLDTIQDLPYYINLTIKKEIKKEQLNIVDKGNGACTKNTTSTPEQLKKQSTPEAIRKISSPTPQTKKYSKKIARIAGLNNDQVYDFAQDLQNSLPEELEVNKTIQKINKTRHKEEIFKRLRKNAALAFYVRFIYTFYSWVRKDYLPETAGISTIFYVEQVLQELETNKDYYFGACQTEEHLQYQTVKLEKALESTRLNYQSKLKQNPDYNWKYNYPNTFLSKLPGKNSFCFKNSILHIEKTMIRTNQINAEYEKQMTRYKLKRIKDEQNKQIHTAAWYIYQNSNRVAENINITLDYFKNDEELRNNFKAFILNRWAVKKWMRENPKFKPDQQIITDCFIRQQKLEEEIKELLPDLHKKIRYSEKNRGKVGKYVMLSNDYSPIVRFYNQQTYDFISNFIN